MARVRQVALASAVLAMFAAPAASAKETGARAVAGTWQTIVPVSLTSYQPSPSDPTTGDYTGVGSTMWQGTWTGVTHYRIRGTANLVTGAGQGAIEETFIGRAGSDEVGTLIFSETYTLDATGRIKIHARITGGTGAFESSVGVASFDGIVLGVITGSGSYVGRWTPRRHR